MQTLVLVSRSFNGKRTIKVKMTSDNELFQLEDERRRLMDIADKLGTCPDYRVLGPRQLKALQEEIKGEQAARRAKGAKKAAVTRAKTPKEQRFILCPTCGAKSKKLCSEFGGLQTRRCQRGHTFEHDKWLSDRAFWAPILTGRPIPPGAITRPVKDPV